jgi:hypothetical protein
MTGASNDAQAVDKPASKPRKLLRLHRPYHLSPAQEGGNIHLLRLMT